jgi:hypothetical protein
VTLSDAVAYLIIPLGMGLIVGTTAPRHWSSAATRVAGALMAMAASSLWLLARAWLRQ